MNNRIQIYSFACIVGAIGGFILSSLIIEWFTTAFQLPLAETNTFGFRAIFAAGCSLLFVSAPITASVIARSSSALRWVVYLMIGCLVSTAVFWYLRTSIQSGVASIGPTDATAVSLRAFPNMVIPLSGILAIILIGFIQRFRNSFASHPG